MSDFVLGCLEDTMIWMILKIGTVPIKVSIFLLLGMVGFANCSNLQGTKVLHYQQAMKFLCT